MYSGSFPNVTTDTRGAKRPLQDAPPVDDPAKRARLAAPSRPASGIMFDWLVAQDVLDDMQRLLSESTGHDVRFDGRHRGIMRDWFMRNVPDFWRMFDQICDTLARAEWTTIRDDARFIQSILSRPPQPTQRPALSTRIRSFLRNRYGSQADEVVPDVLPAQQPMLQPLPIVQQVPQSVPIVQLVQQPVQTIPMSVPMSVLAPAPVSQTVPYVVGPPGSAPPQVQLGRWEGASELLDYAMQRVSDRLGRTVELDSRHKESLRVTYGASPPDFWSVAEQLVDKILKADWRRVRDQRGFVQSMITFTQPQHSDGRPEAELVASFLSKLGPNATNLPTAVVTAVQPAPQMQHFTSIPAQQMVFVPQQFGAGVQQQVLRARPLEEVLTWDLAERVCDAIGERVGALVGRHIVLDTKHREALHRRWERDPLGFWSVLDQVQDRMMQSDWSDVRNDARFVHSWLSRFEPVDRSLSDFMRSMLPVHPDLSSGMPPHLLRRPAAPKQQQQQGQANTNITWEFVEYVLKAIERRVTRTCAITMTFDQKHTASLRDLYDRERDKMHFILTLDGIQELLLHAEWATIRDPGRFIQSLVHHHPDPHAELSSFMQSLLSSNS